MRALSSFLLFTFPTARGLSYLPHYKASGKRAYRHTSNVCTNTNNMADDYDGPHPSTSGAEEDSNSSLQTQPPSPQVSDASNDTTPPAKPPRSADIPPDPTPRPPEWVWPYHEGLTMESARQQAIQHWHPPKHSEYGSLARRTRTFYQGPAQWDPEGKPSVGDLARAGFYYDGGFTIIITII